MKRGVIMRNVLPLAVASGVSMLLVNAMNSSAMAREQEMRPVAALKILVEARELNARCDFAPEAKEELADYAAKAEVAAAAREGVEAVRKALDEGHKEAQAQECSPESKDFVLAALDAAREAMQQARAMHSQGSKDSDRTAHVNSNTGMRPQKAEIASGSHKQAKAEERPGKSEGRENVSPSMHPQAKKSDQERAVAAARSSNEKKRGPKMLRPPRKPEAASKKSGARSERRMAATKTANHGKRAADTGVLRALERRYVVLAGTYYLDLRCKRLPYPVALSLYKKVKALHYRLLKKGGPQAILRAKAAAKARAAMRTCRTLKVAAR